METSVMKTAIFLGAMTVILRLWKANGKTSFCWAKSVHCCYLFGTAHICLAEKHCVTPQSTANKLQCFTIYLFL